MTIHSGEELFRQTAFIGYYFHWPEEDILKLSHLDRERYCGEISRINRRRSGGDRNLFEV